MDIDVDCIEKQKVSLSPTDVETIVRNSRVNVAAYQHALIGLYKNTHNIPPHTYAANGNWESVETRHGGAGHDWEETIVHRKLNDTDIKFLDSVENLNRIYDGQ